MHLWTSADIGDQQGQVIVVTGANSGIGLETTRLLANAGATVVMACRNVVAAKHAVKALDSTAAPSAAEQTHVIQLDLANFESVQHFSNQVIERFGHIDVLINNAGVMAPPSGGGAALDLQWATNHLGHFALTGHLLPAFIEREARVVSVSSLAAEGGNPDRMIRSDGSLPGGRRHRRFQTYQDTKWANLVFALELNHRLAAADSPAISVAAHPGISHTNLAAGIGLGRRTTAVVTSLSRRLAQPAANGALPIVRAATDSGVEGGQYYGPAGSKQRSGAPKQIPVVAGAATRAYGRELWERSAAITGVQYLDGHGR